MNYSHFMVRSLYRFLFIHWQLNLFFTLIVFIIGSCFSKPLEFEAGWMTRWIEGTMFSENEGEHEKESFIIVLEYFSRFIQFEEEKPIYIPRAKLIRPDMGGNYRIPFDLRASAIEVVFIAPERRLERFRFQRQMGIGELRYDAKMVPESNWREHLVFEISPFLENFILEPRYKLALIHQLFIGNWLDNQKEKIGEQKLL